MTNKQLLTELTAWKMQIDQSNEMLDTLITPLMLSPESPLYSTVWALQGALTKAVAKIVGDESEWLDWFLAENNMGKGAGGACPGTGKPTRKIKDLADLAWLIEESK